MFKNYFFVRDAREKKYCVMIFFLSFGLVYKYVRKTVVQHKTFKRIKFVVWKQSGFFNTLLLTSSWAFIKSQASIFLCYRCILMQQIYNFFLLDTFSDEFVVKFIALVCTISVTDIMTL
jgi:hypothetical protein